MLAFKYTRREQQGTIIPHLHHSIMPAELHPAELAASYAALILHDANLPVKSESITAICKAANVAVPAFWPKLFQDVFATRSVGDFLLSSAGAAPAAAAPAAAGGAAPAAAAKEEPKKKVEEEKKEESDEDMGFGLFD